jgi:hypothetical protein
MQQLRNQLEEAQSNGMAVPLPAESLPADRPEANKLEKEKFL